MEYMKYNFFGKTYELYIKVGKYSTNDNLAITLYTKDDEPFANLTTNIQKFNSTDVACVDTNNVTEAINLISQYNLGKATGEYLSSGFCIYPIYKFDLKALQKYTK